MLSSPTMLPQYSRGSSRTLHRPSIRPPVRGTRGRCTHKLSWMHESPHSSGINKLISRPGKTAAASVPRQHTSRQQLCLYTSGTRAQRHGTHTGPPPKHKHTHSPAKDVRMAHSPGKQSTQATHTRPTPGPVQLEAPSPTHMHRHANRRTLRKLRPSCWLF